MSSEKDHYLFYFIWFGCAVLVLGCAGRERPAEHKQFLSDSDKRYSYIESLQAAVDSDCTRPQWLENETTKSSQISPDVRNFIMQTFRESRFPTRCESPIAFIMLDIAHKTFINKFSNFNVKTHDVPIATARIPGINALTIIEPATGQRVIVVHRTLFAYYRDMARALASAIRVTHVGDNVSLQYGEDIIRGAVKNTSIRTRFLNALRGTESYDPLSKDLDNLARYLTQSSLLFVLGHEYAHVALSHKPMKHSRVSSALGVASFDNDSYAIEYSWRQEFEADLNSYSWLLQILNDNPSVSAQRLGLWGADFALLCLSAAARVAGRPDLFSEPLGSESDILEQALFSCVEHHEEQCALTIRGEVHIAELSGHPPAWLRRRYLRREMIHEGLIDTSWTLGQALELAASELYNEVVHELFNGRK